MVSWVGEFKEEAILFGTSRRISEISPRCGQSFYYTGLQDRENQIKLLEWY